MKLHVEKFLTLTAVLATAQLGVVACVESGDSDKVTDDDVDDAGPDDDTSGDDSSDDDTDNASKLEDNIQAVCEVMVECEEEEDLDDCIEEGTEFTASFEGSCLTRANEYFECVATMEGCDPDDECTQERGAFETACDIESDPSDEVDETDGPAKDAGTDPGDESTDPGDETSEAMDAGVDPGDETWETTDAGVDPGDETSGATDAGADPGDEGVWNPFAAACAVDVACEWDDDVDVCAEEWGAEAADLAAEGCDVEPLNAYLACIAGVDPNTCDDSACDEAFEAQDAAWSACFDPAEESTDPGEEGTCVEGDINNPAAESAACDTFSACYEGETGSTAAADACWQFISSRHAATVSVFEGCLSGTEIADPCSEAAELAVWECEETADNAVCEVTDARCETLAADCDEFTQADCEYVLASFHSGYRDVVVGCFDWQVELNGPSFEGCWEAFQTCVWSPSAE